MTTVYLPPTIPTPYEVSATAIDYKASWLDAWTEDGTLQLAYGQAATAGSELSTLEFRRPYGRVKHPQETSFATRAPLDLDDYWVRLRMMGPTGYTVQFVGQVSSETRQIMGSSAARTGWQTWSALGGEQLLRKAAVSRSWWIDGEEIKDIGWTPDMNSRNDSGSLVGNRSTEYYSTSYIFGGTQLWTRYQFAEYILARFADASAVSGPSWTLAGQASVLDNIADIVTMPRHATAWDVLRRLIDPQMGLDFVVLPNGNAGFLLAVFSLARADSTWDLTTLPANENSAVFNVSRSINMRSASIVKVKDHTYDRIRVLGGRVVVCRTFKASDGHLEGKWSTALETAYKAGTGTPADTPREHDIARQAEKFRPVYQDYGVPDGFWPGAPLLDAYGQATEAFADGQSQVRKTLPWLPLLSGYDY
ncbi:MAG TPA: hypothetical protein VM223_15345, partial [Planctomycetota bacterium]|nr:hypothetical protein [Planctomycetota bacterium]